MSYIRMGHPLTYVEGNSEDYVFPSATPDGKGGYKVEYIEDYGSISDSGFIELLYKNWKTDDEMFKQHFIKRLAERLDVKLRKKPLIDGEYDRLDEENLKKFKEEDKGLFKK